MYCREGLCDHVNPLQFLSVLDAIRGLCDPFLKGTSTIFPDNPSEFLFQLPLELWIDSEETIALLNPRLGRSLQNRGSPNEE